MDPGRGRQRPDLTEGDRRTPSTHRAPGAGLWPFLGTPLRWHLLTLVAGALFLMYVNRDQWFFGDEWDFLANRSVGVGDGGLFQPHNEHWSTSPMLIYGLLFRLVGLSSYGPYVAVLVLTHLAVVHLMWRVMLRSGVGPGVATVASAAFIPFGPGAENILWAFQIGFVGSVALGLAFLLLADHEREFGRRDVAGWGVGVLGLTFSGVTVPLLGMAALMAWLRRGLVAALVTIAVPTAAFLAWFALVGGVAVQAHPAVSADSFRLFPQFVGAGVGAVLSWGTPTPLVGVFALVLTAVALVIRGRGGRPMPVAALASAAGGLLLIALLAVGRAPLGVEFAASSRYVYIGAALLLPLSLVGISDLTGGRLIATALMAAVAVSWGVHNALLLHREADLQAERERLIREQLVAAGTVLDRSTLLQWRPDPIYTPDLGLAELDVLLSGFRGGIHPSREAILRAALVMQVSATDAPEFVPSAAMPPLRADGGDLERAPSGCLRARPTSPDARLMVPLRSRLSLGISAHTLVGLELAIEAGGIRPDYGGSVVLSPGRTRYLNVAIDEGLLGEGNVVLGFAAPITICPA